MVIDRKESIGVPSMRNSMEEKIKDKNTKKDSLDSSLRRDEQTLCLEWNQLSQDVSQHIWSASFMSTGITGIVVLQGPVPATPGVSRAQSCRTMATGATSWLRASWLLGCMSVSSEGGTHIDVTSFMLTDLSLTLGWQQETCTQVFPYRGIPRMYRIRALKQWECLPELAGECRQAWAADALPLQVKSHWP